MRYSIALTLIALMLCFSSFANGWFQMKQIEYYNSTNCAKGTLIQPTMFSPGLSFTCSPGCSLIGSASQLTSCDYSSIRDATATNNTIFVFSYESGNFCSESNFKDGYSIPVDTCVSGGMLFFYVPSGTTSIKTSGCDTLNYYSDSDCTVLKSQVKISSACTSSTTMSCKLANNRNVEKSVMNNALTISMNSMLLISLLIVAFLF